MSPAFCLISQLDPAPNIPPAEAEMNYYQQHIEHAKVA